MCRRVTPCSPTIRTSWQLNADKLDLEREQLSASISDYDTQIGELERERDKVSANKKLQYTIQIQSAQVSQKEAELNLKTKEAELEKPSSCWKTPPSLPLSPAASSPSTKAAPTARATPRPTSPSSRPVPTG